MGYVVGIRKELLIKHLISFAFSLLGLILLGCLAFLIGAIGFTAQLLSKRSQKKQNILIFLVKLFFALTFSALFIGLYPKPLKL
jgi:hypothetical protein